MINQWEYNGTGDIPTAFAVNPEYLQLRNQEMKIKQQVNRVSLEYLYNLNRKLFIPVSTYDKSTGGC